MLNELSDLKALLWQVNPGRTPRPALTYQGRTSKHAGGHKGQAYKARRNRKKNR